jgi:hypothetical protein
MVVTTKIECDYKGIKFVIESVDDSDDACNFRTGDGGWYTYTAANLKNRIDSLVKAKDESDATKTKDKESNKNLAKDLCAFLDCICDAKVEPVWHIDRTDVRITDQYRFVVYHRFSHRRVPLKPVSALNKIMTLEAERLIDVRKGLDGGFQLTLKKNDKLSKPLQRAVARSLKRRGERKEAAITVSSMLDRIYQVQSCLGHRQPCLDGFEWRSDKLPTVVFNKLSYKFLISGEWMLPLSTLDKLAGKYPTVAKILADPNTK